MALPVDRRIPPEARSLLADAEGQWVRLWTGDDWFALADAWVRERLAAAGIAVSGRPVPYKIRFWAAVWCYPTDHGLFWFKENNPGQAFEAALVAAMAQALPHHVVAPLAIDPLRGWMLTADQGPTLDEQVPDTDRLPLWRRLVTEYAGLQRDTVPAEEALLASGLTSLAPSRLADAVHSMADWFSSLGPGHPLRLDRPAASPGPPADPITLDGVRRAGDALAGWGTRLTGAVPMALDQNDLHVHNVFSSNPSAPFRFFDFGDAVWGHPFATLPCVRAALTDPENVGEGRGRRTTHGWTSSPTPTSWSGRTWPHSTSCGESWSSPPRCTRYIDWCPGTACSCTPTRSKQTLGPPHPTTGCAR